MLLVAYTRPDLYADEADDLTLLLQHVDSLHIRKEEKANKASWRALLKKLPAEQLSRVWIHDHYELCTEFRLGGIHLTREALKGKKALGIFAAIHNTRVSVSVRTPEEAAQADELYERLMICPVFPSISKEGHQPEQPVNAWKEFLAGPREAEAIALGGIGLDNIQRVKATGFDGAAVLGSLWYAEPVTGHRSLVTEKSLVTRIEALRTACSQTPTY